MFAKLIVMDDDDKVLAIKAANFTPSLRICVLIEDS